MLLFIYFYNTKAQNASTWILYPLSTDTLIYTFMYRYLTDVRLKQKV